MEKINQMARVVYSSTVMLRSYTSLDYYHTILEHRKIRSLVISRVNSKICCSRFFFVPLAFGSRGCIFNI